MLASNPLLKDGRYRLDQLISAGPKAHLYTAFDNLAKQPIVILKNEIDVSSSGDLRIDNRSWESFYHDGIVRIADNFHAGNYSYTVTEPLTGNASPNPRAADRILQRLGVILNAISTVRSEFPLFGAMEMSPQTFFETAENKVKLLLTYPAEVVSSSDPLNSPYLPLEKIWDELDHINQKAIYRTYDENALAVLESPADERSDLYSLGAVFYRLITGVEPLSAFERSIEMLDTRVDPLNSPRKLNPEISAENSDFIVRLLELRRERRFGSTKDAISRFPSAPKISLNVADDTLPDDMDLLEIPVLIQLPTAVPVAARVTTPIAAPVQVKDTIVEKPGVETPVAKKPFVIDMVTEASQEPRPEPASIEPEIVLAAEAASSSPDAFLPPSFKAIEDLSEGFSGDLSAVSEKRPLRAAAMVAAAVVLIAGGGWGIFTFSTSSKSAVQTPSAVLAEKPQTSERQPQVAAESTPQTVTASEIEPLPAAEPTAKTSVTETGPPELKPRPQIAETKQVKPKEKKPNEERPKKKLTVDDLIRDN